MTASTAINKTTPVITAAKIGSDMDASLNIVQLKSLLRLWQDSFHPATYSTAVNASVIADTTATTRPIFWCRISLSPPKVSPSNAASTM